MSIPFSNPLASQPQLQTLHSGCSKHLPSWLQRVMLYTLQKRFVLENMHYHKTIACLQLGKDGQIKHTGLTR